MNFDVHSPTEHSLFVRDRPIGAHLVFVDIPYITPIALAFLTPGRTVKSSDLVYWLKISGRSRSLGRSSQVSLPDQHLPSQRGKRRPPLGPNGFANAGFC
jgi:hypothetical protein